MNRLQQITRRVRAMDNDREQIVTLSQDHTRPTIALLRNRIIKAYKSGGETDAAFDQARKVVAETLQEGMLTAHVAATANTYAMIKRIRGIKLDRTPFSSMLDALQRTADFSTDQLDTIREQYAVKSKGAAEDAIDAAKQLIGESARKIAASGINTRSGILELGQAMDRAGLSIQSPRLLETVYRTEFATAYSDARMAANDAPEIQSILWGFQFVTVGDDRVRPTHAALDGARFAKDDPRWAKLRPPFDWNCRCSYIEIFVDEAIATKTDIPASAMVNGSRVPIAPAEGFDRAA